MVLILLLVPQKKKNSKSPVLGMVVGEKQIPDSGSSFSSGQPGPESQVDCQLAPGSRPGSSLRSRTGSPFRAV